MAEVVKPCPMPAGDHVLRPPAEECPHPAPVTAVAISCCGNFGFVGSASGRVDRYNMQSGLHRGSYQRCSADLSLHPWCKLYQRSIYVSISDLLCEVLAVIWMCNQVPLHYAQCCTKMRSSVCSTQCLGTIPRRSMRMRTHLPIAEHLRLYRGQYLVMRCRGDSGEPSTSGREAHDGAVTGISSDACNRLLVTAGADGALRASALPFDT